MLTIERIRNTSVTYSFVWHMRIHSEVCVCVVGGGGLNKRWRRIILENISYE